MADQLLDKVMSPEAGVEKMAGSPPPGVGRPPAGPSRGPGGPPGRAMAGPPPAPPALSSFAKRLDTLENKTVYMVDIGFGGGYNFMVQLQKWFADNMPSVTTVVRRKPGNVFSDDKPELWEEVKARGDAVVLGVAG
jgi:hypothetical protein